MHHMDNSLTFPDKGCIIDVYVRRNGDMIDNTMTAGWGIPEGDISQPAVRFYRGKHGDRITGPGLVLALGVEIVNMHDRTLSIQRPLGKHTTVTRSIPYGEVL